jgi:hypothetical protein
MKRFECHAEDSSAVEHTLSEWLEYLHRQYVLSKEKWCNTHNDDLSGFNTGEMMQKLNDSGIPTDNAFLISLWEGEEYRVLKVTYYYQGSNPMFKYRAVLLFQNDVDAVMYKLASS